MIRKIVISSFGLCCALLCSQGLAQTYDTILYTMANTPVLTTNSFRGATVGKGNNVYIGSANQGIYRFNGSSWSKIPVLTTHNIRGLACSPVDSTIWVAHTGTGNQGTSQYINGGVHHLLDTVSFAFTYYGAIAGLPTRAGYGIGVASDNTAWSSHLTQLTAGVTAGGGVGKMISGSTTASSIYTGLPSGNWASDVRCLSMGVGPAGFWVGVDRSCYNGTCKKSYVARYNLASTFTDSIAASNSPIPFSNAVGGSAARAIDFDAAGRGWIGLSTGGAWVLDAGTWKQVPVSVFPSGAAVNYQSIAHESDGTVYIGTSQGLLVYFGGDPTDIDNYAVYLPTMNITGVTIDQEGTIWLATTAGIVKMFMNDGNSIEGTLFNTRISYLTGQESSEIYPFCKVYLYDNAVLTDSATVSTIGYFKFSDLDTTHTYNLFIKGYDLQSANIPITCTILDADIGIPYTQIRLPYDMHVDIVENLKVMEADTFAWSYLFGAISIDTLIIPAYNPVTFATYELAHRNYVIDEDNPIDKEIELMGRLVIQSNILAENKKYAAKMAALFTKEACDLGFLLFEFVKTKELPSHSKVALLVNAVNRRYQSSIKGLINKACDYLEDPVVRTTTKTQLNAAFDAVSNFVEEYSTSSAGGESLTTTVVKELVSNLIVNSLTPGIHKGYYVQNTKQVLPAAMAGINTYPFAQPLSMVGAANIASANATARTTIVRNDFNSISGQIELVNTLSGISSATTNLLEQGTMVTALSCVVTAGLGCATAAALKSMALILKGLNFAGKAVNVGRSAMYLYDTKTSTSTSAGPVFDRSVVLWPAGAQASVSGLQTQTANYNQKITKLGSFLQAGNRDSVLATVSPLIAADSMTNKSMLDLSKVVFSASPAAYQADPAFSDFLSTNFINKSMNVSISREAFNYLLVAYIIDSVTNYADTLNAVIPEIIQKNNEAVTLYDSLVTAMAGLPLSQQLFATLSMTGNCSMGSSYPVTVEVQNITNVGATGAYAVLEATGGVTPVTDSVYIGTIAAGQTMTVTFYTTTPMADTTAQLLVTVGNSAGPQDSDAGALNISGIGTNVNVWNVSTGSGVSGCYNALQALTIAGNGTTFAVQPGGDVSLIAGQKIVLKPGTRIYSGGHLLAHITTSDQYCVPYTPDNRTVPSTVLSNYQLACYDATQTLTTGGTGLSFTVQSGCQAELIAGRKISLMPETKVLQGGYLHAAIAPDGPWCASFTPDARVIPSTTLSGTQSECFDAIATLAVGGNGNTFIVQSGAQAELIAGNRISINTGTKVYSGGKLHAWIAPNGPWCSSKSVSEGEAEEADEETTDPGSLYTLYPNPVGDHLFIRRNARTGQQTGGTTDGQVLQVEVYSTVGKLVQRKSFEPSSLYDLPVEWRTSGLYLVRLVCGDQIEMHRIIRR